MKERGNQMSTVEKSAAYKIFHYYYKVYIAQHFMYSSDYIKAFGIPTSGDKDIDKTLANSKTLVQLTIAQMADKLDMGASMSLEDPKISVEIYDTIRQHLLDWDNHVRNSLASVDPPLEDLQKLDKLAAEVYKIAKVYMVNALPHNSLISRFRKMASNRPTSNNPYKQSPVNLPNEHKPIADAIAKEAFAKKRNW